MIHAAVRFVSAVRRLTWAEITLTTEAAVMLTIAQLALHLLPFRQIAHSLGQSAQPIPDEEPAVAPTSAPITAIRRAIVRAQRRLPWKAACLAQAIAGRIMLGNRGISSTIHFGVRNADGFAAHAWLVAGSEAVTGFEIAGHFKPIARIHHQG